MKLVNLFIFVIICCAAFVNSKVDCEGRAGEFLTCFVALLGSKAETECKSDGKCPSDLMDDLDECIDTIYKKQTSNPITALKTVGLSVIGDTLSYGCEKKGGKYCYDYYRETTNSGNVNKTEEFNCSKCGKAAVKRLQRFLDNMQDKDSKDYEETKKKIDAISICGALANYSVKLSSIALVLLTSMVLLI